MIENGHYLTDSFQVKPKLTRNFPVIPYLKDNSLVIDHLIGR